MDTFGWDIVSACSQTKLNELLSARLSAMPPKVSYSDGGGVDLDLVFAPWQITAFGSDLKLTLDLPILSGTLRDTSKFASLPSVDLAGVTVEVTLTLAFIDNAAGSASDLVFSLKTAATTPADKTPGAVYVRNPDVTGALARKDPTGVSATKLGQRVAAALVAHADKLAFALSTVNLQPSTGWMKPVQVAHMFAEGPARANGEPGEGYLVVAMTVRTLPAGSQSFNMDPALFSTRFDFFMLIAGDLFLQNFVLPELGSGFLPGPAGRVPTFVMAGDGIMGLPILFCPEVDHWGTGYHPVLTSFLMSIDGTCLQTTATGMFQITGLGSSAYVEFQMQQNSACTYSSATGSIAFSPAPGPAPTSKMHLPWYEWAAGAVVTPIVGPLVALIVTGVVDGVIAAVTNGVTNSVTTSGATGGLNGLGAISVGWPGATATAISECGLSSAFYMRGTIT